MTDDPIFSKNAQILKSNTTVQVCRSTKKICTVIQSNKNFQKQKNCRTCRGTLTILQKKTSPNGIVLAQETHRTRKCEVPWAYQWGRTNSIRFSHGTSAGRGVFIALDETSVNKNWKSFMII